MTTPPICRSSFKGDVQVGKTCWVEERAQGPGIASAGDLRQRVEEKAREQHEATVDEELLLARRWQDGPLGHEVVTASVSK